MDWSLFFTICLIGGLIFSILFAFSARRMSHDKDEPHELPDLTIPTQSLDWNPHYFKPDKVKCYETRHVPSDTCFHEMYWNGYQWCFKSNPTMASDFQQREWREVQE